MLLRVWYFLLLAAVPDHWRAEADCSKHVPPETEKTDLAEEGRQPSRDCGFSPKSPLIRKRRELLLRHKRIAGGKPAIEGDWPWVAALLDRTGEQYLCGAALLHTYQHVLTAYHCVEKQNADDILVRLGTNDLSQTSEDSSDHLVSKIILHPDFNKKTRENNLAILKLVTAAVPSDYIRSICLPTGRLVPGQIAFIAGWGTTHTLGPPSDILMETTLPIWRTEFCNQTLNKAISHLQVCAGWKAGDKDACAKDGGSPMMVQLESGRWEIVGVVGARQGCARDNSPGIYTRISAYNLWITSQIVEQQRIVDRVKGCGISADTVIDRIVNGKDATPGMWPWMASLQLNNDKEHSCGAVLITDQHVLTATHCVKDLKATDITVRLGEHDFEEACGFERSFPVDRIWTFANYSHRFLKNDIAILRLKERVAFDDYIKNVCLPDGKIDLTDAKVVVIGWGQTGFFGPLSPVLQQAGLNVWRLPDCQQAYPRLKIDTNQICASHKTAGRDSCQGDSGGPLLYQQANGRWAVVGIVSGGQGCGESNKPGIYTRVSAYIDWIKATVLSSP